MQLFTKLFYELDATTRTNEKVRALEAYFAAAAPEDAAWALHFLIGRKVKRAVNTRLLRDWVAEVAGLPLWLVEESYDAVGDLAETLALLLPTTEANEPISLQQLVEERVVKLAGMPPEEQRQLVVDTWRRLGARERLVWHKLILGEFRVGVARTLVARAVAAVAGVSPAEMSHRLMGHWQPSAEDYSHLLNGDDSRPSPGKPYPFYLAHPLESPLDSLGDVHDWQIEWKWDGIRAQLIRRQGEVLIWSRGEELITDRFPEALEAGRVLPDGTVLDGEILAWQDERPLPFAVLQRRIGRKQVSQRLLREAPTVFMAYDLMEYESADFRSRPQSERRATLEQIVAKVHKDFPLRISPLVEAESWEQIQTLHTEARERAVEGLMLKRRASLYGVGRPRGDWWKWKTEPYTIDAVLIYAQRGHGRRASLYTDYTFGVWDHGALVPIAKAYSGLTDAEIAKVDHFVRHNTTDRFGPVRVVRPELVFELHFEGIQVSTRHKAGLAVRFPRMGRWRTDKPSAEADTLDALRAMAQSAGKGVAPMKRIDQWIKAKGWRAFAYQRATWEAYLAGESGLVNAPTGTGKSYSVWLAVLREWLKENRDASKWEAIRPAPLRVLWITPMRALANDIVVSLRAPIADLKMPWTVEQRTGDTSAAERKRQRERLPTALVTTPESLSLMLSYPDSAQRLRDLRCVIIDEWHELLGTKRGVQTELGLARLRQWNPSLKTWALSATLGNLPLAAEALVGHSPSRAAAPRIISGKAPKKIQIETILPADIQRFPWAGHLGLRLLPDVIKALEKYQTTLLFTNTRSQTEIWFRALLAARPDWAAELALHHGSLDRDLRSYVEGRLREGSIRCVVCTSSLDLGVDFSPVDQVIQVGSPKGIARLLQRAGRSGHRPGAVSRVLCVPTHAFELVEYSAARTAALAADIEERFPLERSLDVLVQHLVTIALAGGFNEQELYDEVRTTHAFRNLTRHDWLWALDFVSRGGPALRAYPQYSRLAPVEGRYQPTSPQITRLHRLSIGTITSDASVLVKFMKGSTLGTIEESFIGRLKPGDCFAFAGRTLEFIRFRDLVAYVRPAKKTSGVVPRWDGGRFPLSSQLARAVRMKFADARLGIYDDAEMRAVEPVLALQQAWSHLPGADELLIERCKVREGHQTFIYPFEGRSVNEGLAMLLAFRISRETPCSITITPNDYGFELLSNVPIELDEAGWRRMFSTERLLDDLYESLNAGELARRQFRDISRVAGLVFMGYPGAPRSARQLQASTSLIYDVFLEHDPDNRLLDQARREVLEQQLEESRLSRALQRIAGMRLWLTITARLTPLAFPLWAARIQTSHVSSERWTTRVHRMIERLEKAAAVTKVATSTTGQKAKPATATTR